MSKSLDDNLLLDLAENQFNYCLRLIKIVTIFSIGVLISLFSGFLPIKIFSFEFDFNIGTMIAFMLTCAIYFLCFRSLRAIDGYCFKYIKRKDFINKLKLKLKNNPSIFNPFSDTNSSFLDYIGIFLADIPPFLIYWITVYFIIVKFFKIPGSTKELTYFLLGYGLISIVLFGLLFYSFGLFAFYLWGLFVTICDGEDGERREKIHFFIIISLYLFDFISGAVLGIILSKNIFS